MRAGCPAPTEASGEDVQPQTSGPPPSLAFPPPGSAPWPPGAAAGRPLAATGRPAAGHAGATAKSEAVEGRGWKWLVLALALYITADKTGLLSGQAPGSELSGSSVSASVPGVSDAYGSSAGEPVEVLLLAARERWLFWTSGHPDDLAAGSTPLKDNKGPEHNGGPEDAGGGAAAGRLLGGSSSGSSGDSSGSSDSHASHPHEAVFFLVIALALSITLMHMEMHFKKGLQMTVVLFVLGVIVSVIIKGCNLEDKMGPIGRSYVMWMTIDPHVLLFTLLPPLLAGDAMSIDTQIVKKVAYQCMYLAGPGVAINAGLTALFLKFYLFEYDWPFLLCLTTGAILCATDPVAVVALLKELGASPTLTVQIQGESLLNDGTAIVLYTVSYNMLKDADYDHGDMIVFLVKTALYAWLLGMLIGYMFYLWIKAAKNKLDHHSGLIQVSLTIACAYASFLVAEGVFKISGVLSTVAASLVLAHKMWPQVVEREAMHTIWHVLEYLGNTIIFFLAGALTGRVMVRIPAIDWLHLLVIYIVLIVIRGALFLSSMPLLKYLHSQRQPVRLADAIVMTWGGLRGAVGLALAIQVSLDRAGGRLTEEQADKVLFYVGGVALLTLAVNAMTCPALVRKLGITQMPEVKLKLAMLVHGQMNNMLSKETQLSDRVLTDCTCMMKDVENHMVECHSTKSASRTLSESDGGATSSHSAKSRSSLSSLGLIAERVATFGQGNTSTGILNDLTKARNRFELSNEKFAAGLLEKLPEEPLSEMELKKLKSVLKDANIDVKMTRAVNEAFLNVVMSEYWKQLRHNEVFAADVEPLLQSVKTTLSRPCYDLTDFKHICHRIVFPKDVANEHLQVTWADQVLPIESYAAEHYGEEVSCVSAVVHSTCFNVAVMLIILANSAVVFIEDEMSEAALKKDSTGIAFLVLELIFTSVFTVEFLLRFADLRLNYFRDPWNLFDFLLVVIGIVTVVFTALGVNSHTSEAQAARSLKILKILRAFRAVRLIKMVQVAWHMLRFKKVNECGRAEHFRKLNVLLRFIIARIAAQHKLIKFLGINGETARCIVQAQIALYDAMTLYCHKDLNLEDNWMLEEVHVCEVTMDCAEELEKVILRAVTMGMLSSSEGETMVHSLTSHLKKMKHHIGEFQRGVSAKRTLLLDEDGKPAGGPSLKLPAASTRQAPAPSATGSNSHDDSSNTETKGAPLQEARASRKSVSFQQAVATGSDDSLGGEGEGAGDGEALLLAASVSQQPSAGGANFSQPSATSAATQPGARGTRLSFVTSDRTSQSGSVDTRQPSESEQPPSGSPEEFERQYSPSEPSPSESPSARSSASPQIKRQPSRSVPASPPANPPGKRQLKSQTAGNLGSSGPDRPSVNKKKIQTKNTRLDSAAPQAAREATAARTAPSQMGRAQTTGGAIPQKATKTTGTPRKQQAPLSQPSDAAKMGKAKSNPR